jgi:hypothetical protein
MLTVQVIRDILKTNAKQDIATLFICDKNIVPGRSDGAIVYAYNESLEALQLLTDGRIHVWDGESVKEWHYEAFPKDDFQNHHNRTLHIGSTIDVDGMQIVEIDHNGKVLPEHSIAVTFTFKKFWKRPEEPKYSGYSRGGYTGGPGDSAKGWDDFFRQNFNRHWEDFMRDEFFRRSGGQQHEQQQQQRQQSQRQNTFSRKDDYAILGIARSATDAEVKSAYRRLAKQWHPDANEDKAAATEKMKEINASYANIKSARGFK